MAMCSSVCVPHTVPCLLCTLPNAGHLSQPDCCMALLCLRWLQPTSTIAILAFPAHTITRLC